MKIRTLIIDDEPPARQLIATLLRAEPDVTIEGECDNGRIAVDEIRRVSPDLVFLDVKMPVLDGFGVLAELAQDKWPLIVFVTAYDKYAVRAFEVHACDYLLKPFEYHRVRLALDRARVQLRQHESEKQQPRLVALLEDISQSRRWDRLAIRDNGRVIFLRPADIDWIEADGNYIRLHAGTKAHLLRETMLGAESRLSEKNFLRVSRSALVNLDRNKE
jgi:two-component system, LytTR family, response regulator